MEWRDPETGQIKIWVWIVAAGGLVLIFLLVSRGQRSVGEGSTVAGQSSQITEYLNQLNESVIGLTEIIGSSNIPPVEVPIEPPVTEPPPTTTPPPVTEPPPTGTPPPSVPSFILYTVKRGDTLIRIAQAHGTNFKAIMAANPDLIKDKNFIRTGWTIKIPTVS